MHRIRGFLKKVKKRCTKYSDNTRHFVIENVFNFLPYTASRDQLASDGINEDLLNVRIPGGRGRQNQSSDEQDFIKSAIDDRLDKYTRLSSTSELRNQLASVEDNMQKVLAEMKGEENRDACFRTIISLVIDGKEFQFEGIVEGQIIPEKWGDKGFGYDPIFLADGFDESFAQMSIQQKNEISHRGLAVKELIAFLKKKI